MIDMKPNTMPTAPLALVPNWPTNAVSTRLYTFVTSIEITAGTDSPSTSFGMGVRVIFSYCVLLFRRRICIQSSSSVCVNWGPAPLIIAFIRAPHKMPGPVNFLWTDGIQYGKMWHRTGTQRK